MGEKKEETRKTAGNSAKFGRGITHADQKEHGRGNLYPRRSVRHDKMTSGREFLQLSFPKIFKQLAC